jgi:hypothetical protein
MLEIDLCDPKVDELKPCELGDPGCVDGVLPVLLLSSLPYTPEEAASAAQRAITVIPVPNT